MKGTSRAKAWRKAPPVRDFVGNLRGRVVEGAHIYPLARKRWEAKERELSKLESGIRVGENCRGSQRNSRHLNGV